MNRVNPETLVDKAVEISVAKYPVYQHKKILAAYKAHILRFKRTEKGELKNIWKGFSKFISWYYITGHPFLMDTKGNLFMPYDPESDSICPTNPKTLICNWQRRTKKLKPQLLGRSCSYLLLDEYITGERLKLRYTNKFNLELFKRKLLGEYFNQFHSVDLTTDISKLKTVVDIYNEVLQTSSEGSDDVREIQDWRHISSFKD